MATQPTGPSSARRPLTPTTAEQFALAGPSDLPDPSYNAYRKDLADVALAGRVIASHYAEPVERRVAGKAVLLDAPSAHAQAIGELDPGTDFLMLDDSLGWAWGYAGPDRRVGYLPSEALTA